MIDLLLIFVSLILCLCFLCLSW